MVKGLVIKGLEQTIKQALAQATYTVSTSRILVNPKMPFLSGMFREDTYLCKCRSGHLAVCSVVAVSL